MKKILIPLIALFLAGCASNANQKLSAPLFGVVHNEYYVLNVQCDGSQESTTTNFLNRIKFGSGFNSETQTTQRIKASLGRGNDIFAIDNQVLVGHDIGNATSNDVNASASIPLTF